MPSSNVRKHRRCLQTSRYSRPRLALPPLWFEILSRRALSLDVQRSEGYFWIFVWNAIRRQEAAAGRTQIL